MRAYASLAEPRPEGTPVLRTRVLGQEYREQAGGARGFSSHKTLQALPTSCREG
jgi:hypothetical protein